jgi:hypothetical protein
MKGSKHVPKAVVVAFRVDQELVDRFDAIVGKQPGMTRRGVLRAFMQMIVTLERFDRPSLDRLLRDLKAAAIAADSRKLRTFEEHLVRLQDQIALYEHNLKNARQALETTEKVKRMLDAGELVMREGTEPEEAKGDE